MLKPEPTSNEAARLEALRSHKILDTPHESAFDDLTRLAARICETPMALVSLVDADRQWFKSKVGIDASETSRDIAFCAYAIHGKELFVVPDTISDERFAGNPLVTDGPKIRFYAGTPLVDDDGNALGTFCVLDRQPRNLTPDQTEALRVLADQVMTQIRFRSALSRMTATADALAQSERFAQATVDSLSAQMAILDQHGTVIAVNAAWRKFARENGATSGDFLEGANYLSVCDRASGACAAEATIVADGIRAVIRGERDRFELEYPCHSPTERRWFLVRVSTFSGPGPTRIVVAHEDVTVRREAEDRLRYDSLHDGLTGLPNRANFNTRVRQCLSQSRRHSNYHFAVLFIDLDRFKVVNDSLGHAAGDLLLVTIARRLRNCLRTSDNIAAAQPASPATQPLPTPPALQSDPALLESHGGNGSNQPTPAPQPPTYSSGPGVVGRLGGDEFTVLLDGLQSVTDAAPVAQRILDTICQPVQFGEHEIEVTASIGIVVGHSNYVSEKDILRDADAAMYKAKAAGKNRFALFDDALHDAAIDRLRLESDLRRAAERNELVLHFQPIVSLATRELIGFEALVRWQRDGDLVPPSDFIPVAEETGTIIPIGIWVLETACAQLAEWHARFPNRPPITISVNVSRKQFTDPNLIPTIRSVLAKTRIPPASLKLEITESVIMDDAENTSRVLAEIKTTGVRLSMDDFGTGYSSLSCLHQFPIDELKVDHNFVAGLEDRRDAAAVLSAVITLAHDLKLTVVAEGIVKMEQIAFLQTVNCDYGQGYLFAKPMDAHAAAQLLNRPIALAA